MGQQFDNLESTFLCGLYKKNFLKPSCMVFSLAHYLYICVFCVDTCVYIRVYNHIVLKICSGSSHASHLDTTIKFDWTNFFSSVIPRVTVSQ